VDAFLGGLKKLGKKVAKEASKGFNTVKKKIG
jgi:hypothetical protein